MAPKERNFFNHEIYVSGLKWYLDYFEKASQAQVAGEVSPTYAVMRPQEIRLAKRLFSQLKIILVVRHPVERMWSSLRRHWTYSYLPDVRKVGKDLRSMLAYADRRLHDAFGDYANIYANWATAFGKDRLLVLRFDEVRDQQQATMKRVLDFIGVSRDVDLLERRDNEDIPNRSKANVQMPPYLKYYLSRRYLARTKAFDEHMGGLVQDWIEDMEECISSGRTSWEVRYRVRDATRYRPEQLLHRVVDPVRMWWKVSSARNRLTARGAQ
jgi:hypothetical protein